MYNGFRFFWLCIFGVWVSPPVFAQSAAPSFRLDEMQKNYEVFIDLPGGNQLLVYFARMGDWSGKNSLIEATKLAARQYAQLEDSFHYQLSQKSLFLKAPMEEEMVLVQYQERNDQPRQLVYSEETYYPLKSTSDTLRIVKDQGRYEKPFRRSDDSMQTVRQVAYTFILKDLSMISGIADDEQILQAAGHQIDSVLGSYRTRWTHPESALKRLAIRVDYTAEEPQLSVENKGRFWNNLILSTSFGVELFNQDVVSVTDAGVGYSWGKVNGSRNFIMVNLTSYLMPRLQQNQSNAYGSIGLELGVISSEPAVFRGKSSFGMAWFFGDNFGYGNPKVLPNMFRFYFNLPLYHNINVGLDLLSNLKMGRKAQESGDAKAVWGVFIKYNL